MCGIAGFLTQNYFDDEVLINMSNSLRHRGPDSSGYWRDENRNINFCHLRLAILDVSPEGAQPMFSRSNRYVVVFNGEIYNFLSLKEEIEYLDSNIKWKGHSDTEVFLAAIDCWGIEATIKKLVGMFAIAVWDSDKKELFLIRDRIGEKPLYYGWQGETFIFSSELKAIKRHPAFENKISSEAVASFFKYSYIPAPLSIYSEIFKLKPGTFCKVSLNNRKIEHTIYWSFDNVIQKNEVERKRNIFNEKEIIVNLERVLEEAIRGQMVSDVPLGAFLSGGVDSSTIVALMQVQSLKPIKTFSIGFEEEKYNEAIYSKKIAEHLKTDHTELYVTSQDAINTIPLLPYIYDEPFSDSSQIPTYLLSKLVKQYVTVSLSGDAGDEIFSGYNRYILAHNTWDKINKIPLSLRKSFGGLISKTNPEKWNSLYNSFKYLIPKNLQVNHFGDKIHKASFLLDKSKPFELYDGLISHWKPEEIMIEYNGCIGYNFIDNPDMSFIEQMMRLDTLTYLPDDILVKVDRAAMANSLETRVPFLDHRVIEFAWQIPLNLKMKKGVGKHILKEVLYKHVPKELIERPKMGFGVPLDLWLRGPLKEWAANLLSKDKFDKHGFLNYEVVQKKWLEHLSEKHNWQNYLWDVLMFQSWFETNQS